MKENEDISVFLFSDQQFRLSLVKLRM